jgi:small-conductance mechanosensitive channel/CRP-like cAMP-binding protein
MDVWTRLGHAVPLSAGFLTALVLLATAVLLRQVLDPERRGRIRNAIAFLILALIFPLAAAGIPMATAARDVIELLAILFLIVGGSGVAGVIVFDVALARMRLPSLLRDLAQATAVVLIVMAVLRKSGFDLLSLITTSAVLTAVIGLALQSTIANVFAGLVLQLDRTLGIGDWIQVAGHVGKVTEIRWRSTSITTKDGDAVIVPNNDLMVHEVLNFSRPRAVRAVSLRVGFHYRHPPNDVRAVLLQAVRGVPGVLAVPAPESFPAEFGDSAVTYTVRYWIADFERDIQIAGEVRTRIWYAAGRSGLEIPFPIRTILSKEGDGTRSTREVDEGQAERLEALARIGLFSGLPPADQELLAREAQTVRFAAGEKIVNQMDAGDSLYIIHRGRVSVTLSADNVQREIATLGTGDVFGEMSLMTGEPRTATCVATTDVVCYVVDHAAFRCLLSRRPEVAEELSQTLALRELANVDHREVLSADARAHTAETSSRLLARMRTFFRLG